MAEAHRVIPDFRVTLGVGATKCQLPTLPCGRAEVGWAPVAGLPKSHTASKSEQPLAPGLWGEGWAGTWPSEWTPAGTRPGAHGGFQPCSPAPGPLHSSWRGGGLGPEEGQWRDGLGSAGLTLLFSFLCSHQNGRGNLEIQGLQQRPAQWPAVAPMFPGLPSACSVPSATWGGGVTRGRGWGGAV